MTKSGTRLAAAVLALSALAGCNGDGGAPAGGTAPRTHPGVLDVAAGYWEIIGNFTGSGTGCIPIQPVDRNDVPFCDGIDLNQQAQGLGLNCSFTVNDRAITGTCHGVIQFGTVDFNYNGSVLNGTVAQDGKSFAVVMSVSVTPEGGGTQCNYTVDFHGQWTSAGPCPAAGS